MAVNDNGTIPFKPRVVTPEVTPKAAAPDAAVISILEDYLQAAKDGKVKFVALASVDNRGVAYSTWEPDDLGGPTLITQALGAVSFLSFRFNQSCAGGAEFDDSLRSDPKPDPKTPA
jgi:hypothetical protein